MGGCVTGPDDPVTWGDRAREGGEMGSDVRLCLGS